MADEDSEEESVTVEPVEPEPEEDAAELIQRARRLDWLGLVSLAALELKHWVEHWLKRGSTSLWPLHHGGGPRLRKSPPRVDPRANRKGRARDALEARTVEEDHTERTLSSHCRDDGNPVGCRVE